MKIYCLSILLVFNLFSIAQSWVKPIDIGGNYSNGFLFDIHFKNNKGWAVGYNQFNPSSGQILKTEDGGKNWKNLDPVNGKIFRRAAFADENIGWVVGENGAILKTTDGGTNWIDQSTSNRMGIIYTISVIDNQNLFIGTDSGVFKTLDGGTSWTLSKKDVVALVQCINANIGFYLNNNSELFKTTDGGSSWVRIRPRPPGNTSYDGMNFYNDSIGWIYGSGSTSGFSAIVSKTTDGGATWVGQPQNADGFLTAGYVISKDTVVLMSYLGSIIKTTNGGSSWIKTQSNFNFGFGSPTLLTSIHGTSSNNIWIVGDRSYMRQSTDVGTTWQNKIIGGRADMYSAQFCKTDKNKLCAVGNSVFKVFLSDDAGKNWTSINNNPPGNVSSVAYINPNSILVSSDSGIYHSTNQGTSWVRKYTILPARQIYNLYFFDDNTGWAVGDLGLVVKTTDGGNTWTPQTSGTSKYLNNTFFTSSSIGFIVGDSNIVLKTTNGGTTWTAASSPSNLYFNDVLFTSANNGWIVGSDGGVFKTTDGGFTWTTINIGSTDFLVGIRFRNATEGWIYGWNGTLYYTNNGGSTWVKQTNKNINAILNMNFNSDGNGILCGTYGHIQLYRCATLEPIVADTHFLKSGDMLSSISVTGTNIKWYSDLNKVNLLPSSAALLENTTYYVSQTANGCESDLKKVFVKKCFTAAPTGNATQNFTQGAKLSDLTVSGTNIKWYANANKTSPLPSSTVLIDNTRYYASQTINNCEGDVLSVLVKKLTVGISNNQGLNNSYYYNNTSKELIIHLKSKIEAEVKIMDINGRTIYTNKINSEARINLSNFNQGIYFVLIEDEVYKINIF